MTKKPWSIDQVVLPPKPDRKDFTSDNEFLRAYEKYRHERQRVLKEAGKDPVAEKALIKLKERKQKRKRKISKWRRKNLNNGSQSLIDKYLEDES